MDFGRSIFSCGITFVLSDFGAINMQTTLAIFSGLPGTGKSTLANKLARELRWPLLRIDDVVGEMPENPNVAFWDSKVRILLGLTETQLKLGLSVIVDSVFMNMDRNHVQNMARKHQAHFRPIYVFVSDENVWKERVTTRSKELNHNDIATWEQIQRQRGHFRKWEPNTALFIDSLHPFDQNYEAVFNFVTEDQVDLQPLSDRQLVEGKYHA
jgi:predicted kinase